MTRALSASAFLVAVLLYGASSTLFFLEVLRKDTRGGASRPAASRALGRGSAGPSVASSSFRAKLAPALLGAAAAFHLGYVTFASLVARVCPVDSVHFSLSMASILASAAYLVARLRYRIDAIGVLLAPFGLVFLLGTFFLGQPGPSQKFGVVFIAVHVMANLAGAALFMLAGGAALLYLIHERRLKQKRSPGLIGSLPPLEVLDQAVHRFLITGFPLLTLGVLSGTIWAKSLETGRPEEILRAVLGYGTWLLIATVLLLRVAAGWRGRRSAYGTIAAFVCVAAVLTVYLVRPVIAVSAQTLGGLGP